MPRVIWHVKPHTPQVRGQLLSSHTVTLIPASSSLITHQESKMVITPVKTRVKTAANVKYGSTIYGIRFRKPETRAKPGQNPSQNLFFFFLAARGEGQIVKAVYAFLCMYMPVCIMLRQASCPFRWSQIPLHQIIQLFKIQILHFIDQVTLVT